MKRILSLLLLAAMPVKAVTLTGAGATDPCNIIEWGNCGCYPWYTSSVRFSQSPTPPCVGSYLVVINTCTGGTWTSPNGVDPNATLNIPADGGTPSLSTPPPPAEQPVPNPSSQPIIVGQTHNGQLTGNYVVVPPGGTGQLPISSGDPGDGGWGILPIPPGDSITFPTPPVSNGSGGLNGSGGTWNPILGQPLPPGSPVPPPGGGDGNTIGGGANSGSIIPDPPNIGNPGDPNAPPPLLTNGLPNVPPGYSVPTNIDGSGTINFPTSPTNSTGSNLQAGFSAVVKEDSLDSQAIIKAIQAADANNQNGQGGISNSIKIGNSILSGMSNHLANIDNSTQQLTNQGNLMTNLLGQIASNTVPKTNGNYDPNANTDSANAATGAGASSLQGLGDKFALNSGSVGGSPGDYRIALPGVGSWNLDPLNNGAMFADVALAVPWVRTLSQWAMTAWFLFWLVGEVNQVVRDASHLPQGASAEGLPIVGSVTALVAAGVVLIALTVLITYISSLILDSLVTTFLTHPFGSGGSSAVQSGISLLDAVFDIGLCLSLMAQRLALSFYLSKAYFICAGIVRFAVG
jgi:hypothetical protein